MSKLLRVLALAALLAALHLAGSTAVAHANSGPAVIGDGRRPPTQGQVGEAWHPRVSVPMRPSEPTSQPGRRVAALAALAAAALAVSGGLVAKRTGWRVRPQQTT
jgi:hypothetical protein